MSEAKNADYSPAMVSLRSAAQAERGACAATRRRSCATRPPCSTITRSAVAIVSGRCATMMRVSLSARTASLTVRSRARRARWWPRRGRGCSAACTARAPAGCAASGRPRARCPCRRSACCSPSASRRCRRGRPRAGRSARSRAGPGAGSKKQTLSAIEPANSWSSCITVPTACDSARGPAAAMARRRPGSRRRWASSRPSISFTSVVLPHPEGPTMATDSPGSMRDRALSSTNGSVSE